MSPLVKELNNGNWLPQNEAEALRDELFYQRAIHAYMTMLPALNVIGMRDGSEAAFARGYNVLPIWKDRMDSRTWVPTPNADVIYSMSYLNSKETGPLVVAAPSEVIDMFTDFFQRTITDVGLIGPDRARGGECQSSTVMDCRKQNRDATKTIRKAKRNRKADDRKHQLHGVRQGSLISNWSRRNTRIANSAK